MYPSTLTVEQAIIILITERKEVTNGVNTIEICKNSNQRIEK